MSMLSEAEDFYAANRSDIDAVVADLQAKGVTESDLDEVVHEMAEDSGFDSAEASTLNNQGLAYQVAAIFQGFGRDEGMERIRTETNLPAPKP